VFSSISDVHPYRRARQTMARPCGLEPAGYVQRITYIMWRICDAQSCEGNRRKALVKGIILGEKDCVGRPKEFNEAGQKMFDGGLSLHRMVGDAVHVLNVWGDEHFSIDVNILSILPSMSL
jgi:hypothetical protein